MQKHFKAAFAFSSLLFMSMPLISQEVTCIHPVQCQTYETSLKKEDFVSVSLTDKDNGWIMSHSGSLFRYKDGALIRDQKIGLNHASCVAVADQNLAWAIADFTLFRYDGTQWKKEDLGFATSQLIKIHVVDAQHAYALGFHGTLLKYDNGVWSKIQLPEPYADQFLFNASFIDAHTGWIIAESAILKYKDGAFTATPLATLGPLAIFTQFTKIQFVDESEGWVTSGDDLYHFHDGVWDTDTVAQRLAFSTDIQMADKDLGILVGVKPYVADSLVVVKYIHGSWIRLASPVISVTNHAIYDMDMADMNHGLIVGIGGLVIKIAQEVTVLGDVNQGAVQDAAISIIPNPSSDLVFIESSSKSISHQQISILDAKGVVYKQALYDPNLGLQVEGLPSGLYFLRMHTDHGTLKFVKE